MNNFFTDNESLKFYLQHPDMQKVTTLKEQAFAEYGKYDDAPANPEQAIENYAKVAELVGDIAANVIAPNAESNDQVGPRVENGRVIYAPGTQQNHEALRDAGLYGMTLPRKHHGLNFPYVAYVMSDEIISRADAGFATIWGLQDCAETMNEFASDEINDKYLSRIYEGATCSMDLTEPDAGSDLQSVRLKATWDEASNCWRLNGVKRFITNGDADLHLVLARSEEGTTDGRGLSYFVYDKADGGLTVRRIEHKMGIIGSPTCELVFTNAPAMLIGDRRMGLIKYVMSLMNGARLCVGSQSLGLSEAAYRAALAYAASREQYGKTIDNFAQVQDLLADMKMRIAANRTLLYETARQVDIYKNYEAIAKVRPLTPEERTDYKTAQRYADILTPILKLTSSEWANRNAYDSIQVHGGSGFMKEYECERLYRDARVLSIYEGTSQLQVVAAIKGIGNGAYLKRIADYDAMPIAAEYEPLREVLRTMTEQYKTIFDKVSGTEAFDHNARRMTDGLAYIIMGYLLLQDASRSEMFADSCRRYIAEGRAHMAAAITYVM